ncbi:hypothetical protein ACFQZ1_07965 [Bacillus sp. CGMCC 1.60114]|uniref:hypothetical protein n=1 Tax=unclassified Bacillus (in: firmicutes) TaxID=185979 RepID=UPI00363F0274
MKAYQVSDGEYSRIVFTETPGQAKQCGMDEFGIDFIKVEVRRAKWADRYKCEHLIPKEAYLDNGWWWECRCGTPQYKETAIVIGYMVYCEKCKGQADVKKSS